jgi:CheY-like chemotaxis protein
MLVKHLTGLMGGKIYFTSKENTGTEFTLQLNNSVRSREEIKPCENGNIKPNLPLSSPEKEASKPVSEINDSGSEAAAVFKILVVDDNQDFLEMISGFLSSDYKVITARNGVEAVHLAKKNDISVIVSDLMMPEMDGRMMCHEIKNSIETCHIPVILLTALTDSDL